MKFLLSLLFVFTVTGIFAQSDSVFKNENLVSVTEANGRFTSFDEDGNMTGRGILKNGKREGEWEFFDYGFDPNNKDFAFVHSKGNYKNGQRQGEWTYSIGNQGYSTNAGWNNKKEFYYGYVILTGKYVNDKREGTWLMKDIANGKTIGRAYFENGNKKPEWELEKGLSYGKLLTIHPHFLDSVKIKEIYDNGNYGFGFYSGGKKTGQWEVYDTGQQLLSSTNEGGSPTEKGNFSRINIVLPNLHIDQVNRIIFSDNKKYVLLCQDKKNGEFLYWLWNVDHKKMISSGFLQTRANAWYEIGLSNSGKKFYLRDYTDNNPYTYLYIYDVASGKELENLSAEGHLPQHFFYGDEVGRITRDQQKGLLVTLPGHDNIQLGGPSDYGRYVRKIIGLPEHHQVLVMYSQEISVYDINTKKQVRSIKHEHSEFAWADGDFLVVGAEKFNLYHLGNFQKIRTFEIPGYEHSKMDETHLDDYINFRVSAGAKTIAVSYEKNSGFSSPLQVIDEKNALLWQSPMDMGDCDDDFLLVNDSCIILPRYDKKPDGYCSSQLHWYNFRKNKVDFSTHNNRWFGISSLVQSGATVSCAYQYPGKIFNERMNTIDLSTGYFSPLYPFSNGKAFQLWGDSIINRSPAAKDIRKNSLAYFSLHQFSGKNNGHVQPVFFNDVKTSGPEEKKLVYYAYGNRASYENNNKMGREVVFWNGDQPTETERKVTLQVLDNGEHIFYSGDRYYMGSKNIRSLVYFEKDLKLYPFEQFDLKYNRPDIILARLGYADTTLINAYRKAYLKRLKKMNFTEEMLKDDAQLPEIMIRNAEQIPAYLEIDSIELNLQMNGKNFNLDRINIWINDVPLAGANGIDLRGKNTLSHEMFLKLHLAQGENKIQVSVLNQAGVESLKETIYTSVRSKKTAKPDLYLVSIGAGKFTDQRYDLNYAAKDAQDISTMLGKNANTLYRNVYSHVITNQDFSEKALAEIKKTLEKAGRNDVVMITVSDHGVLDKNFDYYLATHDMDFNDPAAKGIAYEKLEALLDGIQPLKKVLLVDACHSGEVDKEDVQLLASGTAVAGNGVKFRNAGAGIRKKNLGLKSSAELMGELFTDLRRGTGASVISSAGGVELAMESDQWKNGLFTYCFLKGISEKTADLDHNGEIMVSELQQYLQMEVNKLSGGKQQPTSRQENTAADFRIW